MTVRDESPTLAQAFPSSVRTHVEAVWSIIPATALTPSSNDIGPVTLNGETLRIPARIYNREPNFLAVARLSKTARQVLACIYTRHHNGYVRQRALERLIESDHPWATPFVVQLLGEYVLEI